LRVNVSNNPDGEGKPNRGVGDFNFNVSPSLEEGYGEGWFAVTAADGLAAGKIKLSYSYDRKMVSQMQLGLIPESWKLVAHPQPFYTFHAKRPVAEHSHSVEPAIEQSTRMRRSSEPESQPAVGGAKLQATTTPKDILHEMPTHTSCLPHQVLPHFSDNCTAADRHSSSLLYSASDRDSAWPDHDGSSCSEKQASPSSTSSCFQDKSDNNNNHISCMLNKAAIRESSNDFSALHLSANLPRIESPGLESSLDCISR
jgi:hypothetical protein